MSQTILPMAAVRAALQAGIEVTATLRPPAPLRAAVARVARSLGVREETAIVAHERLLTDEDELGILVSLRAGAAPATVGFVIGEEVCAEIVVVARDARQAADLPRLARELTTAARLGLPSERPRSYRYRAPQGWHALVAGGVAQWFPADVDASPGLIAVHRARPRAAPAEIHVELLAGAAARARARSICTTNRLEGSMVVAETDGRVIETVVVSDGRFSYPVRFESAPHGLRARRHALEEVVESIESIPSRSLSRAACDVFQHLAA